MTRRSIIANSSNVVITNSNMNDINVHHEIKNNNNNNPHHHRDDLNAAMNNRELCDASIGGEIVSSNNNNGNKINRNRLLGFLHNSTFFLFVGLSILLIIAFFTINGPDLVFLEEDHEPFPGSASTMDFLLQRWEVNYAREVVGDHGDGRVHTESRTFEENNGRPSEDPHGRVHTPTRTFQDDDHADGRTFETPTFHNHRPHKGGSFQATHGRVHIASRTSDARDPDDLIKTSPITVSDTHDHGNSRTSVVTRGHVHTTSWTFADTGRTLVATHGRLHTIRRTFRNDDSRDARKIESTERHGHTTRQTFDNEDHEHGRTLEAIHRHVQTMPDFTSSPVHDNITSADTDNNKFYRPCDRSTSADVHPHTRSPNETNGYLVVSANGGLNQMRNGICDMVAIAMIINATLVIPRLDHSSFWEDTSEFEDIFDVKHFIRTLENYVPVVEDLPEALAAQEPAWKAPVSWSKSSYYKKQILPILNERGVVHFSHTDSRLANNGLPAHVQQLRCHACYNALKFTRPIEQLGAKLVQRMKSDARQYVALHLRYEKDMLAFTGCSHGLSDAGAEELREMRRGVRHWKEKEIDGERRRVEGRCPLTPREAALLLTALGYTRPGTRIYIVAGPPFGGRATLAPLRTEFPHIHTHADLATPAELAPFAQFRNRLAAIDYYVALHSDVFIHTFDGNMARALQGHRRFLGHLKTISPHRRGLVKLVDSFDLRNISWSTFQTKVQLLHQKSMGAPQLRRGGDTPKTEENFYANPYPGCICRSEGV